MSFDFEILRNWEFPTNNVENFFQHCSILHFYMFCRFFQLSQMKASIFIENDCVSVFHQNAA